MKPTLIVISGPTAVGKTTFAIELAKQIKAEIISADSRQFFKELSIGTAKPTPTELESVKHHFVNNKSILEDYNANDFEKEVIQFLNNHFQKNKLAIMVGGSGLYINAVCDGFDATIPDADETIRLDLNKIYKEKGIVALQERLQELDSDAMDQIDIMNPKRLMRAIEICLITNAPLSESRKGKTKKRFFDLIQIGLELPREELYQRINTRVNSMIDEGLVNEAKAVHHLKEKNALKTVGYRELFQYFEGEWTLDFAIEKIKINSRRYAKRQITWFKKNESIRWFSPYQLLEVLTYIRNNESS